MGEFEFIQRFCTDLGVKGDSVVLGVGDDAAIVDVPADQDLLVSTDTMNVNQHFYANADPCDLAHKLIHTNVSDIAAMGGQAKWATVALSLSEMQPEWLEQFSSGLNQQATKLGLAIIGGDTTKGPLSMSLTIMGTVRKGQGLLRSGAQPNDIICVTGQLGGAAAGLRVIQFIRTAAKGSLDKATNGFSDTTATDDQSWINQLDKNSIDQLVACLNRPQAQHAIGSSLADYASSCIDISDGLAGDLHHILRASRVNASLDWEAIPTHTALSLATSLGDDRIKQLALYGGEDYQLAFTISASRLDEWQRINPELAPQVTKVGRVGSRLSEHKSAQQPLNKVKLTLERDDTSVELDPYAYQHF